MKITNILLFFILIFIPFMKGYSTSYIKFEYIGETDKPINSILIANEKLDGFDEKTEEYILNECFVVNNKIYNILSDYVKSHLYVDINEKDKYGFFRISIFEDSNKKFDKIIYNRINSIKFIHDIIGLLSVDENMNLINIFNIVLKRID